MKKLMIMSLFVFTIFIACAGPNLEEAWLEGEYLPGYFNNKNDFGIAISQSGEFLEVSVILRWFVPGRPRDWSWEVVSCYNDDNKNGERDRFEELKKAYIITDDKLQRKEHIAIIVLTDGKKRKYFFTDDDGYQYGYQRGPAEKKLLKLLNK